MEAAALHDQQIDVAIWTHRSTGRRSESDLLRFGDCDDLAHDVS